MVHESFMRRCFDLARLGAGHVSPNPMVGAVLVHEGRIIGEGWHQRYGEAHAEVNCLRAVSTENQRFIEQSTLYCSLEPCFHFGKTPPCVDLVLQQKIPRVVISNTDPNPLVAGQSIIKMREAGITVTSGVLAAEGAQLNRIFFKCIREQKPYVILKWAQSSDGFIGKQGERTVISGPATQRLVHKWRSETDAILVGATTALVDNPRLDTRFYPGSVPLRIVLDRQRRLPREHHVLDDTAETWIVGPQRSGPWQRTLFIQADEKIKIPDLLQKLQEARRTSLLVEGGANLLQQFLDAGLWDEIRIIENEQYLGSGVPAPGLPSGTVFIEKIKTRTDEVRIFFRSGTCA